MQKFKKLNQYFLDTGIKVAELLIPAKDDCCTEHYYEEQTLLLHFDADYKGQFYSVSLEIPFEGKRCDAYRYAKQIGGSSCAVFPAGPGIEEVPKRWNHCLQACPVTLPLPEWRCV